MQKASQSVGAFDICRKGCRSARQTRDNQFPPKTL